MNSRTVEKIVAPPPAHMVGDGFRVHNFIPQGAGISNRRMSPFYMLDYNAKQLLPPSEVPRGVGVHPHRGFETVTIAYAGSVAHHDSRGNSGVIHPGDVQWMTAASGVLHKEYHEEKFSKAGGDFQMVQLWVNLPAAHKMSTPGYQAIEASGMGIFNLPDGAGVVEVIAGAYEGIKGPAKTFSPVELYNVRIRSGAVVRLHLPSSFNTALLSISGSVKINGGEALPADHFALMSNDGDEFTIEATSDSVVLVMSGAPIDEPIAAYGPFLMNYPQELQQAITDYQNGKFGELED
ncbi:pirin family protein [Rurimicrobium arvi]|uniref:Pirin family protein n=1 Tax=Rurimicrobium arvi TaxID=2049916 RepID=A0ABP8MLM6_9BACT